MYMKPLPSQEYLREILEYDPSTGELTWKSGTRAGYVMNGRIVVGINSAYYYAARIIWKMMTGNDPTVEIDHADTDTLNNRWGNLREATFNQNGYNKTKYRNNKSGFKGVFKKRGRFRAAIRVDGVIHRLGTYDTAEEANEAYCKASKELHGEFFNPG